MMKNGYCDGIRRRDLLRLGLVGGIGLSLADSLRWTAQAAADSATPAMPARADSCIFIHLGGGPSHLDTLDIKPEAPAEERGEFQHINTAVPGLLACEHLPQLAQALDRFTLIRGISHAAGAHPLANQYLFTGNRSSPAVVYPSLGSVASKERPAADDIPSFVAVPNSDMTPGYLGVAYGAFKTTRVPEANKPFEVRGLALPGQMTLEQIRDRNRLLNDLDNRFRQVDTGSSLLAGMDRFGRTAEEMILSSRAREAFDISRESPAVVKEFGTDELGQSLLLAARLVEFGVRFVTISFGAWDTHLDNFTNLKSKLLPPLDANLPALERVLRQKGLLDRTLVVCSGEFGRTPSINKNAGRDHWPRAMWTLVAGAGTTPGNQVGGTDSKGHGPDDRTDLKPDDLAASIYHALGIDPRREYYTSTGRPVILVPHGTVIDGLFA